MDAARDAKPMRVGSTEGGPDTRDDPAGFTRAATLTILALAMGGFAIGMAEFAAMSVLPNFAREFAISEPMAGHAISAYALGVVIGAPVLAVLGARAPRWLLLALLMVMFCLANLVTALVTSYPAMVISRFVSGLPHGAYFGVAALTAASVVPFRLRARAMSLVLTGLTVATIIGVPIASAAANWISWRWVFVMVAGCAATAVLLVLRFAPRQRAAADASPINELAGLANPQIWLTLAIGTIGFAGMFAVYAYLASTAEAVTGAGPATLPWLFALFGSGLLVGNLLGAWASDRIQMAAVPVVLLASAVALALYPFAAASPWAMPISVFLIGATGSGLPPILQARLMDVAGEAQILGAALNHSAFNAANALGPFLGGLAISAGYGWTSTGWVGMAMSLAGVAVWAVAMWVAPERRAPDGIRSRA